MTTSSPKTEQNPFVVYLHGKLPLVEQALTDAQTHPLTDSASAADLANYLYSPLARFTASGGKRVRPVLALLGAEAVGGKAEQALSAAVAIELFQSAALIHDDIADEGELRRGEPCLYRTEGIGLAINAGDLALTNVIEIVLNDNSLNEVHRLNVAQALIEMERHTLEGQALDLGWVRDGRWDLTTQDYLYMVSSKTAWYTAASPLYIGALAAGASKEAAQGLIEVGLPAGIAFQVQDDLLNLIGDPTSQGKDFRSDITEGKRTLAVVWALSHLGSPDREELITILESSTNDSEQLARAVELIEIGGGIAYCQEVAQKNVDKAIQAAESLAHKGLISDTACKMLQAMADFFVERAK